VKSDILELRNKLINIANSVKSIERRLGDTTTKEEFYDFIRELNDELRKLEKHIATQESLERLRAQLNTQLREVEGEIKSKREINKKLKKLATLDKRTLELKRRLNALDQIKRKLIEVERNYVNWQDFFKKVKEINQEELSSELREVRQRIEAIVNETKSQFEELSQNAATKDELRLQGDAVRKALREQQRLIKAQSRAIKRLEAQVAKLKGKRPPKRIIGKPGLIERGLNRVAKEFKERIHLFPIFLLVIIGALLVVGLVFFREDIFSPELYMDAKSLECRERFECKHITNNTVLVECRYDEKLEGCHCDAIDIQESKCPS